ncbi:hypothetical protein Emin_0221 [Elusimicrobium minutum Pei191]|uniref:Uncharacterized protein n=1 Tax=Elusimicrobium minutum (strain Pei191) TaxID=445932 RepID=B2KB24_ELUMP|nr:hypothetical protein Emin_0221 [Elusimicrobium minutum Pei191]
MHRNDAVLWNEVIEDLARIRPVLDMLDAIR